MPARRTGPEQRPVSRRLLLPAVGAVVIGLVVALLGLAGEAGGKPEPSTTRTTNSPVPDEPGTAGQPPASAPAPPQSPPVPETAITAPVTYPEAGPRTWQTVGGRSPVLGRAGQLLRFRVAVENGITGITPTRSPTPSSARSATPAAGPAPASGDSNGSDRPRPPPSPSTSPPRQPATASATTATTATPPAATATR